MNRTTPWARVGQENKTNSVREAMVNGGLDWTVSKREVFLEDGQKIKDTFAVYGNDNVFGIVSAKFKPIQNIDAFDFMQEVIGDELEVVNTGCVKGGKKVWMTCKSRKDWFVGNDKIENYILCSNSHDGKSALKIAITPVRVVCQNMLYSAFSKAKSVYSVRHFNNATMKMYEARKVLGLANAYMDDFVEFGERAIESRVSPKLLAGMMDELFGKKEDLTPRGLTLRKKNENLLYDCILADDLADYRGSLWQVLNAVSDYETHYRPTTNGRYETLMARAIDGNLSIYKQACRYFQKHLTA